MRVLFSIQCLQNTAQWLKRSYSPNLMNMDKLRINLENSGEISQPEWVNNGNIISHTLDCELQEIQEITIEKIHVVSHREIFISLSFSLNDASRLYKNFCLSDTLNISKELKLSKTHPFDASRLQLPSVNDILQPPPTPMDTDTIQQPPGPSSNRP